MLLDWWFESGNKICRVELKTGPFGKFKVVFSEGPQGKLKERRELRRGFAYEYELNGKPLVINSIKSKKQRFISLYYDRKLVKEYCCERQFYENLYDSAPERYDSVRTFVPQAIWIDAVIAGFFTSLTLLFVNLAGGAFGSTAAVLVSALCLLAAYTLALFGLHFLLRDRVRRKMAAYDVISSVKRKVKKRRKRA